MDNIIFSNFKYNILWLFQKNVDQNLKNDLKNNVGKKRLKPRQKLLMLCINQRPKFLVRKVLAYLNKKRIFYIDCFCTCIIYNKLKVVPFSPLRSYYHEQKTIGVALKQQET